MRKRLAIITLLVSACVIVWLPKGAVIREITHLTPET